MVCVLSFAKHIQTLLSGLVFFTACEVHQVIPYFTCILQMFIFFLHFHQAKSKEEKLKKCGEDEETVPSEYRLKPATVRC